jgi:O-antigen/teichoic acid export membrane protein
MTSRRHVLGLLVLGRCLLIAVYGRSFAGNRDLIVLLTMSMMVSSITVPYAQGLVSLESAKAEAVVNMAYVVLIFSIGIPAIRAYAALGAAATLLVTSIVAAYVRLRVFARARRLGTC